MALLLLALAPLTLALAQPSHDVRVPRNRADRGRTGVPVPTRRVHNRQLWVGDLAAPCGQPVKLRHPQPVQDDLREPLGRVGVVGLDRLRSDQDRLHVGHIDIASHRASLLPRAQQLSE